MDRDEKNNEKRIKILKNNVFDLISFFNCLAGVGDWEGAAP